MKSIRFMSVLLIAFSLMVAIAPATAQNITSSTGCDALSDATQDGDVLIEFGPQEFDAGDVLSLFIMGPGDTFALLEDGEVILEAETGVLFLYVIQTSGTYDFSVEVYGDVSDETTAVIDCTPVSETDQKIEICHYPPGNPENAHTLRVGVSARAAHLAHGDEVGPCPAEVETSVPNAAAGVTLFVFGAHMEIEIWGNCEEDVCDPIMTLDLTVLEPVEGFERLFEGQVPDDAGDEYESIYVIIYWIEKALQDPAFDVFQVNIYSPDGALLDDNVMLFMNEDGEIVGWLWQDDYVGMGTLPDYFYPDETG